MRFAWRTITSETALRRPLPRPLGRQSLFRPTDTRFIRSFSSLSAADQQGRLKGTVLKGLLSVLIFGVCCTGVGQVLDLSHNLITDTGLGAFVSAFRSPRGFQISFCTSRSTVIERLNHVKSNSCFVLSFPHASSVLNISYSSHVSRSIGLLVFRMLLIFFTSTLTKICSQ